MMRLRRFRRNTRGISTIIASALIVAMTVIAAIALGSTVLQIPADNQKLPQLTVSGTASIDANEITLTHLGGDPINTETIIFKTYMPEGSYKGYRYEIPNTLSKDTATFGYSAMHLQTDAPRVVINDYTAYGMGISYQYHYKYGDFDRKDTIYAAPIQAGDTLVIAFDKSFPTGQYGDYRPAVGQQFVVELYSGEQVVTSVTITVQA
jgi:FlaG/FlaF family flagellin (archaellin)